MKAEMVPREPDEHVAGEFAYCEEPEINRGRVFPRYAEGQALKISPITQRRSPAEAYVNCFGCGKTFSFNPESVPSVRVNAQKQPDPAGHPEPFCQECVDRANPRRIANGLPPIQVLSGA
jgi:hypothetical protein